FEPGTKAAYMSYTFGLVIGEVVRRTDPRSRQFGAFIQEEICQPLDLDSLWVGIPDAVEARVATLTNMPPIPPGAPGMAPGALSPLAIPPQVGTTQEVFGRADVPRACGHPGAGGSIGWADPDTRLAVAMTHNRMFRATTPEENPFVPIGEAVRKALGVSG